MNKAYIKYDKFAIADWFLRNDKDVTPKKLRGLMYYAYAWGLVFLNDPDITETNVENSEVKITTKLFDGKFETWVHGAVDKELYDKYEQYGTDIIPTPNDTVSSKLAFEDDLYILEQVDTAYGDFNGLQLERLMRQETPWKNARGGALPLDVVHTLISDEDMYAFYDSKLEEDNNDSELNEETVYKALNEIYYGHSVEETEFKTLTTGEFEVYFNKDKSGCFIEYDCDIFYMWFDFDRDEIRLSLEVGRSDPIGTTYKLSKYLSKKVE